MNTAEWISIDRNRVERETQTSEQGEGVQLRLLVSPYNIPDAINGCYDESRKRFVITFNYSLNEEKKRIHELDAHVRLLVGRHSKRIYEIEVDVDGLGAKGVGIDIFPQVEQALDEDNSISPDNRAVTRNILNSNSSELLSRVSSTTRCTTLVR